MLMMLGLCFLTCQGLVKRRVADAHDAGALFSCVSWALWNEEPLMLMMLGLCSLTCPALVKRRAADAHDAGALFSYLPWACETKSR